jgi:two-component system alkaline phosphatase synthesis response regulator PhoP
MKKILVVEDEQEIRELLSARLRKNNYDVFTASNGTKAIAICKTVHPDLVLLDIGMPEIDGYQTCEKIKQDRQTKNIKVMFLTGKDLEPRGIAQRCETLDASGYISKLSTFDELLENIKKILG